MKLLILPNGDVEAVYDDRLRQLKLGPICKVERASHVEFDISSQMWEARDVHKNGLLCRAYHRDNCVELEKEIVHQQLVQEHS